MEEKDTTPHILEAAFSRRASGDAVGANREFRRVVVIAPSDSTAWTMIGIEACSVIASDAKAGKYLGWASNCNPASTDAILNVAAWSRDARDYALAISWLQRLLCLDPINTRGLFLIGIIDHEHGRYDGAVVHYRRVLILAASHAEARTNLGFIELARGNFDYGWDNYEWRTKTILHKKLHPVDPHYPVWDGRDIDGRTILLTSEQGLGDTIQFVRYATEVARRGAKVFLQVDPSLRRLLARVEGVDKIVRDPPATGIDCQISLMSLPRVFLTRRANIPSATKPYLHADPEVSARWKARLGARRCPRVGIVWSGSTPLRVVERSIPLVDFMKAFAYSRNLVDLICLQKEIWPRDTETFRANSGIRFFGDELTDFEDTAALIEQCDFVITIDTSVAHLSGAMGIDTWLLLPAVADWRWLINEDRSVWYPRMNIFRQSQLGNWSGVLENVRNRLDLRMRSP